MLKINPVNSINTNKCSFKGSNNQYLDIELGYLSDPEYVDKYISTIINAKKTDMGGAHPVKAFVNKLVKTFNILYTPEITKESEKVKRSIDSLIDAKPALNIKA